MSDPPSRIRSILHHLVPQRRPAAPPHIHPLSPTFFLERAASIEPNAEAIVHLTANGVLIRRSYREVADRARGLAYYLLERRLTRVGILAPSTPAFLESIYGIVAAGGVIVPVNYRLKEDEIDYILDLAEVDCILVDHEYEHLLGAYRRRHSRVPLIVDLDTDISQGPGCGLYNEAISEGLLHDRSSGGRGWAGLGPQARDEDGILAIPFTSGTTSRPKGVVYTHRGAYMAAMGSIIEFELNAGPCRYLWTLPMFHAVGWMFPWSVVAVRGTNVCLRKLDPGLVWRLLKGERITHFSAAPTVNRLLVTAAEAERLPKAVRVTVAASPPSGHLFQQMEELNLMPVHVYGMTETYGPITKCYQLPEWEALPKDERYAKMARQGHGFISSLPIRVVKTDGREGEGLLVDVAKDGKEVGEIVMFGNLCARGYYKDADASSKLFAGGGLHSGDLAVWHADGSAQIVDRSKDVIISGGENISSVAIEKALGRHPDILEAGVVAVADELWGERPRAYVTVRSGARVRGPDIVSWVKKEGSIGGFMVPREVVVVSELPKTSTGKIKKNELRAWARGGAPGGEGGDGEMG